MPTLTQDILIAALAGLKLERQHLEEKIAHVQNMLGESSPAKRTSVPDVPTGKRRKRSAAVRRRMAEAQKARWAKVKGESEAEEAPPSKPGRAKRHLSEAGRKAIVAALKKRWAAKKAGANSATAKKTAAKAAKKSSASKKAVKKAAGRPSKKAAAPSPASVSAA